MHVKSRSLVGIPARFVGLYKKGPAPLIVFGFSIRTSCGISKLLLSLVALAGQWIQSPLFRAQRLDHNFSLSYGP